MAQDASPVDAVQRFVIALREIRGLLFADLSPITDVADLRSRRELRREGVTHSGIEYLVHGVRCRMTDTDGREVDVDLTDDPALGHVVEAFDTWRIRWFIDECANDGYTHEEIIAACACLVRDGQLREVVPGRRFALPVV